MHKAWLWGLAGLLAGTVAVAQAADSDDAQMARQCPHLATWIQAKKAEVAAQRKAHPPTQPVEPALRAELLKMSDADQKVRNALIAAGTQNQAAIKAMLAVDAHNLPRIKQIDAKQGFPTRAQVGRDGVQAAWLLVQHADRDPVFQAHVLAELQPRVRDGGISAQEYTLLTDRVLVAQHKPQRYGTQFKVVKGKLQADPMEDPAHVDKRRLAIGLPSMADYECALRTYYHLPTKS